MDRIVKLYPSFKDNSSFYYSKGINYLHLNKIQKSIEFYNKAIKFNPKNIIYYYDLGNIYVNINKKYRKAVKLITQAINLFENKDIDKYKFGLDNIDVNFTSLSENYTSIKELYGLYIYNLYKLLSQCYINLKIISKAEECLKKMIKLKPNSSVGYICIGIFYFNLKSIKESEKYFKEAEEKFPNIISNLNFLDYMGKIYLKLEDYKKSIEYFEKLHELCPSNYKACLNLCYCYEQLENSEKVEEYINKADELELDSNDYNSLIHFGTYFSFLNQFEKSKKYLEKYYKINSDNYLCCYLLGISCYNTGDYKQSKQYFEEAKRINYDEYMLYYYLGLVCLDLEEYKEAKDNLEKLKVMHYEDCKGYKKYEIDFLLLDCYYHTSDYINLFNCCELLFRLNINNKNVNSKLSFFYNFLENYCNRIRYRIYEMK